MSFRGKLRVGKEIDKRSLLNELVFLIDSGVLKLLFGVSKMLILNHFSGISPLVGKLGILVSGVDIVENGELWSNEISEVSDLNITKIKGNEELMMPDHSSQPVVMLPTAESGDSVDRSDVGSEEDETSS